MPIKIPNNLPAAQVLDRENVFYMNADRAYGQDIRPLKLCILNLMPVKSVAETQFLRLLGNSPLQVEVDFVYTESYVPQHTSQEYLTEFYGTFAEVRNKKYDGFLMTGAPVEQMPFEEVAYWDELCEIMEWSKTHAFSSFYICWGAQAGLYYHYGIPKYPVEPKIFGVFKHHLCVEHEKLFRGFDDEFYVPHSRHTEFRREDIEKVPELTVMAEAEEPAGVYCVADLKENQFFISGHAEYDPMTLKGEYDRDKKAGMDIQVPCNYYPDNDPSKRPVVRWRSVANLLFANWLNYYVYQETPYELDRIHRDSD
ncbi:MAG: homoserine O-succinyltransferase [Schwartzia sp.]|jgi:homoserine O-succinyltransferase|uniref:homoserine O-acetyltransferase MetA n=1 Tax=Schwartzia succinivorans TaxID=55507 RepID=UPI002355F410|nr:homoserine O-succinyltransferase [Schwartzia succinivorans]MBQ1469722.1 homoserine O-succinyltransferase [Schwartzia sp. (in: firmicutes)]MBE6098089.1 homoserine O-succinyltransferase [Schwartzia succinivorans]MBQ1918236.1 homoserine O-succinyltransferase [Schwartzia sp. (in: firmicutes)]MBQ2048038.1 homoserine O-succinyltransferase [Schwartzia sp. (in: firmicutes)]MBQ3862546.1 homoserine O-succinyltransferase [Schwartzia sp. (in: firmicutes)]